MGTRAAPHTTPRGCGVATALPRQRHGIKKDPFQQHTSVEQHNTAPLTKSRNILHAQRRRGTRPAPRMNAFKKTWRATDSLRQCQRLVAGAGGFSATPLFIRTRTHTHAHTLPHTHAHTHTHTFSFPFVLPTTSTSLFLPSPARILRPTARRGGGKRRRSPSAAEESSTTPLLSLSGHEGKSL